MGYLAYKSTSLSLPITSSKGGQKEINISVKKN